MTVAELKEQGNTHFRAGEFEEAKAAYTEAIFAAETSEVEVDDETKAALYSNRAACFMNLDEADMCLTDSDHALSLKTPYPRARCRKFWALRKTGKKNDAFTELKTAIEEDPSIATTHATELREIEREAEEEAERMKTEAMGQLKDLGNKFLGLFGLSTDNFQMQQGPDGGYNMQFKPQ